MTNRTGISAAIATLTLAVALVTTTSHAAVNPSEKCSTKKANATAKALFCQAKEQNKLLLGKPADLAKCSTKLSDDFANAEGRANGACPTSGDAATTVDPLVTGVEGNVLTALMAASASSAREKTCATAKNLAGARYAGCQAGALSKRFGFHGRIPRDFVHGSDFSKCAGKLATAFAAQASKGGCLTVGDASAVQELVSQAGDYLPGADLVGAYLFLADLVGADLSGANLTAANLVSAHLSGADLTNANLSGADLSNADLSNADLSSADLSNAYLGSADLSNADLTGVTWGGFNGTVCPDETNSATNGSSPQSCCAHMAGNVPSACSP